MPLHIPPLPPPLRWHEFVMRADSIHYLREKVRFTNPFLEEVASDYFYSFVIAVWEPTPSDVPAPWHALALPRVEPDDPGHLLRVRRCATCGKYRVLPRHQAEPATPFVCSALGDPSLASCASPCPVWLWSE